MIKIIPPPKASRVEIPNGTGVCYNGNLLGSSFSFNIYHDNKIFDKKTVESDFDIPIHAVINKNKDIIKDFCLSRELRYLQRQQKQKPRP
jgi:hypothetical protein